MVEREFLSHLAEENPAVGRGLWRLRQRAYLEAGVPERSRAAARFGGRRFFWELRFPGDAVLFASLTAFFVSAAGLAAFRLVWPSLALSGIELLVELVAFLAAVATFLLSRIRDGVPFRAVQPPDGEAEEPLFELCDLAERCAVHLRQGYRAQMALAVWVMSLLFGLAAWAAFVAAAGHARFGLFLGASALLTASLLGLNWHPFRRAREVNQLANEAELAAARLGLRHASVERLGDRQRRLDAQWRLVAQSLKALRRPAD